MIVKMLMIMNIAIINRDFYFGHGDYHLYEQQMYGARLSRFYRERQLRLYGHVARLPAEDPAHRILSCRDPRG